MTKITKITPAQASRFGEWREKWIAVGLSTAPADFDRAERAALRAYDLCGLGRPKLVLRMSSPYGANFGGYLGCLFLSQVGNQVWSQVWSQVSSQVWSQVGSQVSSQVEGQVLSQVWNQVESQVSSQVLSQVGSQVLSQVYFNNYYHGSFWVSWVAYVSFIRDVLGWDNPILERFRIEEDLVESCNWLWWHKDVLAISDRPAALRRDDQGRLHCEDGPAIGYRDGWEVWSWHGVTVPREWLEDRSSLSSVVALKQENVERRRAACEIVGWDRILGELNARMIDRDPDPEIGELLRVDLPEAPGEQFLRVRCGTGRIFVIPVPPDVPTALAANAWTYDLDPNIMKLKENRT